METNDELTQKASLLAESLGGIVSLLHDVIAHGCPEGCTVLELAQDAEQKAGSFVAWYLESD